MQLGMIEAEDESLPWAASHLYVMRLPQMADHRHIGIVAVGDGFQDGLDVVQFDARADLQHRHPPVAVNPRHPLSPPSRARSRADTAGGTGQEVVLAAAFTCQSGPAPAP